MRMSLPLLLYYYLSVFSESVLTEDLNTIQPSSQSSLFSSPSTPLLCSCEKNMSSIQLENARDMMHQIKNKSGILKKIKHRATHSNDAVWASICLTTLLVLTLVALLQSKMWNDQTFLSYPESQPVKYEQYNHKTEVKVKHLLKSQSKKLKGYFSKKKYKNDPNSFQMESFIPRLGDQVDSSSTNCLFLSDSSEEDGLSEEEFSINPVSGLWEGREKPSIVLYRRSGDSRGEYGLLNTSMAELERSSESSTEADDSEPLISVDKYK